ncbi:MAG TPA: alkaline phosphatase family protein [Thermodesulfobacteriota bacterium]|nr:alkaline phosphatase family protein [Thermodesulfobacteriota bacterium]
MNGNFRTSPLNKLILALSIILLAATSGCRENDSAHHAGSVSKDKKMIIIGFDGMDPKILKNMMAEGKLPNFKKLSEEGGFRELATSVPPQSPVAWSNFITGMNPGGHGIFDFIHRDPDSIIPYLSTSRSESSAKTVRIGRWILPLSSGKVSLLRRGKAFWEYLSENGIHTTIFRVPANFPAIDDKTHQLSGMGTPDIQGTYGTYSYYTDEDTDKFGNTSGGKVYQVDVFKNKVRSRLPGPVNTFRKDMPESKVDFTAYIDPDNPVVKISIQDKVVLLKEGEWSDWIRINYELMPYVEKVSGIARFYLKEVRPNFKLYVTPVNIDPSKPALPISSPKDYSEKIAKKVGLFYTQGIPEDSKALSEQVLEDAEFLDQTNIAFGEEKDMLGYELGRFRSGLLFFYIGRVDQLSHMFWRTMDPKHPAYESGNKLRSVIENAYIEMDGVLGRVLDSIDGDTTVIALSDHGFAPFYRAFNLNTWLKDNGYSYLTDNSEGEFFQNVDWGRTRAYGVGFNGLYLNLKGRESRGNVDPADRKALLDEISQKLLAIRDPQNGQQVITRVYKAEEVYSGPYLKDAPDLIIGYNKGYRASWETVLGSFPSEVLRDNKQKWSGDHLMEAALVPGILLSNKEIKLENPALTDLAPTVLDEFGIPKQEGMIGHSIFKQNTGGGN